MTLFREKITVEAAMRLMLSIAVKRDPARLLSEISTEGLLTISDMDAIRERLPGFEAALWYQIFSQYTANRLAPEELSSRFMVSLGLALRDAGVPESQLDNRLESLSNSIIQYVEHLQTVSSSDLARNGQFVYMCIHFREIVMTDADLRDEGIERRSLQVFNIAIQSYQAAQQAFASLTKEYKLVFK